MLAGELACVHSFLYSVIVLGPSLSQALLFVSDSESVNSALGPPLFILATMQVSHMAALFLGKDNPCVFNASSLLRSIFCGL